MSIPREGSRDTSEGIIVSCTPDVCKTPVGSSLVPIPYSIVAKQGDDANTVPTVRMTGLRAHNMGSLTTKCTGDAPGTGTGVKSGTVGSVCEPKGHSNSVRIAGKWAVRDADEWWMNSKNTVGKLAYVKSTESFGTTPAVELAQEPKREAPEPVRLAFNGEDWANFVGAPGTAVPTAAPVPSAQPRTSSPAPSEPNRIARPAAPIPKYTPKAPPAATGLSLSTLAKAAGLAARRVSPLGIASSVFFAQSTAAPWHDELWHDPFDPVETGLLNRADKAVEDGESIAEVGDWLRGELQSYREKKAQAQAEAEAQAEVQLGVTTDTVRVTEEEKKKQDPCLVGPYEEIKDICAGEAHHIIPDMAYRLGARPVGAAMSSTADRIPNAPTLNQGMSICLTPAQHGSGPTGIHGRMRPKLNALGAASPVAGTAPMGAIALASLSEINAIPDISEECKDYAAVKTLEQVTEGPGLKAPGRTREAPLPSGEARRVLAAGSY
ncbi:uncharacterized protein DUF4150 [Rhodobacter sp. JA431]|uniref:DUF4150 domain-containing protein n=1 Tax=Rhodobacter sp. JA431 TaxID=570013 RepID=UPI000BC59C23|nr:DUF4150 domain-containing protein [Rhodobacter sp. JA431]SOC21958.1 uncharacterized protein DUF4150 [Rhodobacter sp. JA431]